MILCQSYLGFEIASHDEKEVRTKREEEEEEEEAKALFVRTELPLNCFPCVTLSHFDTLFYLVNR